VLGLGQGVDVRGLHVAVVMLAVIVAGLVVAAVVLTARGARVTLRASRARPLLEVC
jgi:hypothetical protein